MGICQSKTKAKHQKNVREKTMVTKKLCITCRKNTHHVITISDYKTVSRVELEPCYTSSTCSDCNTISVSTIEWIPRGNFKVLNVTS
jgi:hypothetical protein